MVPGVQRAGRRLRPRQRADQAVLDARRRRVGGQRPEGVDLARPRVATGASSSPAPSPARSGTAACRSSSCRWTSPASRSARSCRSPAAASSTRCSSPTPAPSADLIVGEAGDGWAVAMGLLGFERGISTLAQQVGFERELRPRDRPRRRNAAGVDDPVMRQRLAAAHTGLQLMRWNAHAVDGGSGVPGPEASISKLFWGTWHRDLGELHDRRHRRRRSMARWRGCPAVRAHPRAEAVPVHAAPTRSTAARTRSSATCSASVCSACRDPLTSW